MAIDNAEKRRSIAGITVGWGITPNSSEDAEWRAQSAWNYSGIAFGDEVVEPDVPGAGGGFRSAPRLLQTAVIGKAKARRRKMRKVQKTIAKVEKKIEKAVAPKPAPKVTVKPPEKVVVAPLPEPSPVVMLPPEPPPLPVVTPDVLDMIRQLQGLYEQQALMQQQAAMEQENEAIEILLLVA